MLFIFGCKSVKKHGIKDNLSTIYVEEDLKKWNDNTTTLFFSNYIFYDWDFENSKVKIYMGVAHLKKNRILKTMELHSKVGGDILSISEKVIIIRKKSCEGCIFPENLLGEVNDSSSVKKRFFKRNDTINIEKHFLLNESFEFQKDYQIPLVN